MKKKSIEEDCLTLEELYFLAPCLFSSHDGDCTLNLMHAEQVTYNSAKSLMSMNQ